VPRSARVPLPPEPASDAGGQAAPRQRPVTRDAGWQGQREPARILANSALSGGFLDRTLELIRASTGADTACILRACDDPLRLAVVAGAGDLHQPRVTLVPAAGPLDLARPPAVYGDMTGEQDPVPALFGYPWRSLATMPLIASGVVIGLIVVAAREPERFSQQTARSLRRAADEIAVVLARLWLAERAGNQEGSAVFLAAADSLLAGATDAEDITMLSAMLVVPRIAEWCAFYLFDDRGSARLAHVWHSDERLLGPLRAELEVAPTSAGRRPGTTGYRLSASEFPLIYGTHRLGAMLLDQEATLAEPSLAGLLDDLSHRIAFALDRARGHRREAATSRVLQQSLRPVKLGDIPGIESSAVYEPASAACAAGGDFYDLFQAGADRWCLALGDVCGNGPEAAALTGLARHAVRLLARDGHGVNAVLDRLNRAVADDYAPDRFLSMLCVEIVPLDSGGVRLRLASAGHPLPLLLRATGQVEAVGQPQLLLGVMPDPGYHADLAELAPGDALICVTDGVTERADGTRRLDDDDGLARLITGWTGLAAGAIADRIRTAVHDFAAGPPHDDVAVLVLAARPRERFFAVDRRRRGPGARRPDDRANRQPVVLHGDEKSGL
jgi:serine phosphatase RsbU (regulator of sigma subunit)